MAVEHFSNPLYVFDLDGTLSNPSPREYLHPHLTDEESKAGDWVEYSMAAGDDLPIEETITLLHALGRTGKVFIVTGRTILSLDLTVAWLRRHSIGYANLYMRGEGDHRSNIEYKVAHLARFREWGWDVRLWVDDYPAVIEAVKAEGVPTLLYHR